MYGHIVECVLELENLENYAVQKFDTCGIPNIWNYTSTRTYACMRVHVHHYV